MHERSVCGRPWFPIFLRWQKHHNGLVVDLTPNKLVCSSANRVHATRVRGTTVFVALTLLSALVLLHVPGTAAAQTVTKTYRIGYLSERSLPDPMLAAFQQGLRDLGYTEGQNIVIESRYAHGVTDRLPELAGELVRLKVDALVVGGTVAARSVMAATKTVPIVFTLVGDPVGAGLVASLARPGGNATGLSNVIIELTGKQLELLKAAVPKISRVAVLHNPRNSGPALKEARDAARSLGLELQVLEVRQPGEIAGAFSAMQIRRPDAVLALSDPAFGSELVQLSRLATTNRLPAMYSRIEFVEAGGLLSYGPNFNNNFRRAAGYVDRILKGAKPGDLPVEQPTRFELAINMKTAKALGLTISQSMLQRADQVIE